MGLTQSLRPAPQTFGPIQFSFSPHFTFEFRLSNVFLRHVGVVTVVAVRSFAGRDGGSLEIRDHEKTYEMEEGRRGSRMGAGLSRWHIQGVQLLPRQRRRQQQHWGSEAVKLWAEIWNFTHESWTSHHHHCLACLGKSYIIPAT